MNIKTYQTVLLGALLHDIGKVLQRGDFGSLSLKGQHPELSGQFIATWGDFLSPWVDLKMLESAVTRHHESSSFPEHLRAHNAPPEFRNICFLISRADNYSAAERDSEKGSGYYRTRAQASVFSSVAFDNNKPGISYYKPGKFSVKSIFPHTEEKVNPAEMSAHIKNFGNRMKELSKVKWPTFQVFFSHLLACLEDYCWCLPASTLEALPDVSLYDHLRTTAAIAGAMFRYHEETEDFSERAILNDRTEKFVLLTGDLTGIQRYIFGIANIGTGGVAKRLRARSFYLSMITSGLAQKIVYDLGLTTANIASHSGGNFYLILPNTVGTFEYLKSIKTKMAEDFLGKFGGELFLNLSAVTFCGEDLKNYGQIVLRAREKLSYAKLNPLHEILFDSESKWKESTFVLDKAMVGTSGYCRSCNKLPVADMAMKDKLCSLCLQDLTLGTILPEVKAVVYCLAQPDDKKAIPLPGDTWAVLSKNVPENSDGVLAVHVDSEGNLDEWKNFSVSRVCLGSYVPVANGVVQDFDSLAALATGKKMIGIVKADVDDLGALFSIGLASRDTISRTATLSRMLESFFTGWLTSLIRERFPNIYLVYAGGDDLLALGPWDNTIDFSSEIRAAFKRFTGNNPGVNLSAGIAVVKPGYPVALGVEMAERNLEAAKHKAPKRDGEGKNQCCLLGETIGWEDLGVLTAQGRQLAEWLNTETVSSQFVQSLLTYARLYDRFRVKGQIEGLKYLSLLNYNVNRNVKRNGTTEKVFRWVQELTDIKSISIRHLGFTARYALLARREKK